MAVTKLTDEKFVEPSLGCLSGKWRLESDKFPGAMFVFVNNSRLALGFVQI